MVDWDLYAWVKRSKQRQQIIGLLEQPRTPTDISEELSIHIAQVSHSLSEMRDREIATLLNPDAKTGRLYQLTDIGTRIHAQLE